MSRLPPLTWLRSFEAAARCLSFTRAAEDLNVTQSAVSQQVKSLEDHLGVSLFRRTRQRLFLTEAGQALWPNVRDAFDLMVQGVEDCQAQSAGGTLTLRVGSSFASQWLVPRLGRFHARFPEVEMRLTTVDREVDFAREDVDAEVRFGHGRWGSLETVALMQDRVFPVCSPDLLDSGPPLVMPSDLARHQLLHVSGFGETWLDWCRAAGLSRVPTRRGHSFDHFALAIQVAINGAGVALGRDSLVRSEIDAGRLVAPFDLSLDSSDGNWLVYPRGRGTQPSITALREWLISEIADEPGAWPQNQGIE
jgi:LysR family glycine cleavage system transcriptional activator